MFSWTWCNWCCVVVISDWEMQFGMITFIICYIHVFAFRSHSVITSSNILSTCLHYKNSLCAVIIRQQNYSTCCMLIVQIVEAVGYKVHRVLQKNSHIWYAKTLTGINWLWYFFEELITNMQASKPCIYFPRYLTCASALGLVVHRVIWHRKCHSGEHVLHVFSTVHIMCIYVLSVRNNFLLEQYSYRQIQVRRMWQVS